MEIGFFCWKKNQWQLATSIRMAKKKIEQET